MASNQGVISSFASLVAFEKGGSPLATPLKNMQSHVSNLSSEAVSLLRTRHGRKATFSPYIGRGILEAGLTSVLFRVDPFRAITLTRFQSEADFDHNSPNNISISWSSDIICHDDIRDIWRSKTKPEAVSRALLSPYSDEIVWQPAINNASDYISSKSISFSFPSVFDFENVKVVGILRGQAKQLYSFWSKGIHGELFAIGANVLDDVTCDEKLKRSIDIVLDLAYLSHFIGTAACRFSARQATDRYIRVKEFVHG